MDYDVDDVIADLHLLRDKPQMLAPPTISTIAARALEVIVGPGANDPAPPVCEGQLSIDDLARGSA